MCNCIRSLHLVQSLTSRKARDINHFLNIWICRWSLRLFIHWSFILLLRARLSILMEVHCRRILHRCCWKICFDRSVILYIQLFQRQWVKYSEPQRNFICHLCCFYQRSHCFWPGRKTRWKALSIQKCDCFEYHGISYHQHSHLRWLHSNRIKDIDAVNRGRRNRGRIAKWKSNSWKQSRRTIRWQ